jgi:hypothetical protein
MDPISASLLAALSALAEPVVKDVYQGLKALIVRKLGGGNKVSAAIEAAEHEPESEGQKIVLQEQVKKAKLTEDPEVMKAAEALIAKVQERGGSVRITASGHGAVAAYNISGSTITTNAGLPRS